MLRKLRKKKIAKKVWVILAIVVVPAFILWGSGSLIRSKQESQFAGRISGKKIPMLEFQDALEAVKNQAIIQFGDNFFEIKNSLDLKSQAWERLILLHEAKKRNIKVSDKEVIELIESYPFFQKKSTFNKQVYSQMLQYIFHTQPRIFEEQTRQNLMLSKLYNDVTSRVSLKDKEIEEEYEKSNEEVSVDYIASLYSDFAKDIVVRDDDLRDFFSKNSLQFKLPLSFNIEYVELVSLDQNIEVIENKAKKIFLRLIKKESFTKIAKENNLTIKETGLFPESGSIPGIGWSPQVLRLINQSKIGQYLAPLRIDKSYYILRLKERKEPYVPDFDLIKNKLKEAFIKDTAKKNAKEKIEKCLKNLKELAATNPKSIDFNNLAKTFLLKSDSTNLFKFGGYIDGIGASDKFWMTAQELKGDEFSNIIEMPTGFYIIKIKSTVPVDEKKFLSEKDEFVKRLLMQKKEEFFGKYLEELKKGASISEP